MAEGSSEESWWGWLQTAKEKVISQSAEVLEFVKNDIDEFTKVVSEEASSVVSSTASSLKSKLKLDDEASTANHVKKSMSGFLSHVAEVFTPPPDDEDEEAFVITNQQPVMLSRLEANVYTQVQDPDTFLKEPKDESDYNTWLETFDLESKQVEMADLLVSCKPLHKHFSMLVPTQVSHTLFWHRYFHLVHRLELQEEKRKQISSRATDAATAATQEMVWEDDEALGGDVDIPEDVQTQLLQQYEEELLGGCEDGSPDETTAAVGEADPSSASDITVKRFLGGSEGNSQDETTAALEETDLPSAPDTTVKREPNTEQPKSIMTDATVHEETATPSVQSKPASTKPASTKPASTKPAFTKDKYTPATTKTSGTASQQMRTAAGQKKKVSAAGKIGPTKALSKLTPKVNSLSSSPTCSLPSFGKGRNSDCNEEEWEKVDASDEDSGVACADSAKQSPVAESAQDPATPADKPKGEDWETWE